MYLRIDEHNLDNLFAIDDSNGVVKNEDSKGDCNSCTYAELLKFTAEIKSKINSRELVFILSKNTVGSLAGYVAFYENQDVSLILDYALPAEMLSALVTEYSPAYIYAPAEWECGLDIPSDDEVLSFKNFKLIKTNLASPAMNENLSFLMTTSGSTGSPKLVRHKYGNLEHNAEVISEAFGWTENEKGVCHLPLHYTMGRSVADSIIYSGGCCVLTESNIMFPGFWKFITEQKATSFTGVPYSYEIALKVKFLKRELPDLKIISVGGGKLSEENFKVLSDYARDTGRKFYSTYGATETSARMSYLPPEFACEKTGSIGSPFRGGEFSLTDEGELVFKGKNVTMGYAVSRADLAKSDDWNGVYHTGDIARADSDGHYYISGRISRFLKLFGTRVGLDESEKLIGKHFETECACTGTDKLMQIFVVKEGIGEEVKSFISHKTALPKTAFEVSEIDEIPHKSSGKVDYQALRNANA